MKRLFKGEAYRLTGYGIKRFLKILDINFCFLEFILATSGKTKICTPVLTWYFLGVESWVYSLPAGVVELVDTPG
ncbi:MAG: hypothetical protein LBJ00_10325 [Planctomycetaceae bacterium]|nr:hypothetical protein [Planctomycetaceae bacterium]